MTVSMTDILGGRDSEFQSRLPHVSFVLPHTTLFLVCFIIVFLVLRETFAPPHLRTFSRRQRWHLPPGPKGHLIIGNLLEWRRARRSPPALLQYLKSLPSYGELTTLTLGSKTWIFLNSPRVVNELISKRGAITHERAPMPISSDLISHGKRTVLIPTAKWTEGRRIMQHMAKASAIRTYTEMQEFETVHLLAACLYRPQEWYIHHYRFSNSVMHRIILGEGLAKSTPQLVELQRVTVQFLQSIGNNAVDFFPVLAQLPHFLQPWRKHYSKIGQTHHAAFSSWWNPVKRLVDAGKAPPSFVRDALLNKDSKYTGNDEEAMYLSMSTISAGSDQIRMVLNTFTMVALCHPDAVSKVRNETDMICGSKADRLPLTSDMEAMPYTLAFIKELLRWRPIVPLIPPHQATEDIEFEGYHFPAGTEFVINAIPVCNAVEAPEEFRPERWLDGNEGNIGAGLWVFGGGKRICVGYKLAQTQLFVAITRMVFCFDYEAAGEYDSYRLNHTVLGEPFPVKITIRSPEHEKLIINEASKNKCLEAAKTPF